MQTLQSEQLYLSILSENKSSPKLKRTIEKCKLSCDLIEQSNDFMSKSSISRIGIAHFGGPAYSTIANCGSKARKYVDLRIMEYQAKLFSRPIQHDHSQTVKQGIVPPELRRLLSDLEQRNNLLQIMLEDLKERLLIATRGRPTRIGAAINLGPDPTTGALQIPSNDSSSCDHKNRDLQSGDLQVGLRILRSIILLVDDSDPLRSSVKLNWKLHNGANYLQAETEGEIVTLATRSEIALLYRSLQSI